MRRIPAEAEPRSSHLTPPHATQGCPCRQEKAILCGAQAHTRHWPGVLWAASALNSEYESSQLNHHAHAQVCGLGLRPEDFFYFSLFTFYFLTFLILNFLHSMRDGNRSVTGLDDVKYRFPCDRHCHRQRDQPSDPDHPSSRKSEVGCDIRVQRSEE